LLNVAITNLTVIALTAVASHLDKSTAVGYAMGARLEYIIIPLAFGIGTGIVAMTGTNWGARQYERARSIAWTGALIVAASCGGIGLFFSLFPHWWMSLFTADDEVVRVGTAYLQITGPAYALYGFGMGLYFACQGRGKVMFAVLANGVRLLVAAAGGLVAVHWLGAGAPGLFAAIVCGFALYAVLATVAFARIRS
jgi:Na+-driven multidrug efflux pump